MSHCGPFMYTLSANGAPPFMCVISFIILLWAQRERSWPGQCVSGQLNTNMAHSATAPNCARPRKMSEKQYGTQLRQSDWYLMLLRFPITLHCRRSFILKVKINRIHTLFPRSRTLQSSFVNIKEHRPKTKNKTGKPLSSEVILRPSLDEQNMVLCLLPRENFQQLGLIFWPQL